MASKMTGTLFLLRNYFSIRPRMIFHHGMILFTLMFIVVFQADPLFAEEIYSRNISATDTEITSWGFTPEEYRALVERKLILEKRQYLLGKREIELYRQKLTKRPWPYENRPAIDDPQFKPAQRVTDPQLNKRVHSDITVELSSRSCQHRNMTPERFRQTGAHTKALNAVYKELDDLAAYVAKIEKRVLKLQNALTKPNAVRAPTPKPGDKTRIRNGVNERGNIPPEQQAEINRQRTGQIDPDGEQSPPVDQNKTRPQPLSEDIKKESRTGNSNQIEEKNISDKPGNQNPVQAENSSLGQKAREGINRHGQQILFLTVNLETIIRCKESGTNARDCLAQMMFNNGVGGAVSAAMALKMLSEGTVVFLSILGQNASYLKLGFDTAYLLYNFQSWAGAEWERYQVEKGREQWTEANLESGALDVKVESLGLKIKSTLDPPAKDRASSCEKLRILSSSLKRFNDETSKLPSLDEISRLKDLEHSVSKLLLDQRLVSRLNEKATGLSNQLTANLREAASVARNCKSEEDAQTIVLKYDTAKILSEQIDQVSKEALTVSEKFQGTKKEIHQYKTTLNKAFAIKERISEMNAQMPSFDQFENHINKAKTATQRLEEDGRRLSQEVKRLRLAFPDDLDAETEYKIHELDQLIIQFQNQGRCKADHYQTEYNDWAGLALEAKLDAENRLRPTEALHLDLSRLNFDLAQKEASEISDLQKDVKLRIQSHQYLVQKAEECKNKPLFEEDDGAHGEDGDSGEGEFEDEPDEEETDDDGLVDESDSGFSDESDVDGEDSQATEDDIPVNGSGFSDESDDPTYSADSESITYFNRDFMPRSWKTSGNSEGVIKNVFEAASRLGWAEAISQYTGGQSDQIIAEHLRAAGNHIKLINHYSFGPHKALQDWKLRQKKLQSLADRISQPNRQRRDRLRKSLDFSIKSISDSLRRALSYQGAGSIEQMENCDSHYYRIGYHTAAAAQTFAIVKAAAEAGQQKMWIRKVTSRANSHTAAVRHALHNIKKIGVASGSCFDMSSVEPLIKDAARGSAFRLEKAQFTEQAWKKELSILEGGDCSGELVGIWRNLMTQYSYLIKWTKNDNRYEGRYFGVKPNTILTKFSQGGKNYDLPHPKDGDLLFILEKVGERNYKGIQIFITGIREPYSCTVVGDYYTWPRVNGHLGNFDAWKRVSKEELPKLKFGKNRYYNPREKPPYMHGDLPDCRKQNL